MLQTAKEILARKDVMPKVIVSEAYSVPFLEELDDNSVIYHIGEHKYRVENITQQSYGIRAVIEMNYRGDLIHKNLVSLFSSRARTEFINKLKGFDSKKIEKHLLGLESELKKFLERKVRNKLIQDKKRAPEMTDEEKQSAIDFLKASNLFELIESDITNLGYVGEQTNKILVYLIATSRKLESPLSGVIKAQSSSGKSQLMKAIVSLMPSEEIFDVSRITENALFWMDKNDLKNKLITVAERTGSDTANYSIRLLQSEKKLRLLAPQKADDNVMKTEWFEVSGPVAFLETTTGTALEIDNQTRVFEIYIDETEEQTRLIQQAQKECRTLEGMARKKHSEGIMRKHQNAQRLLEPLKVTIPYAEKISFPTKWVRTRRDMDRFLDLITVIAFLRQFQREVKEDTFIGRYINATIEDYETAYNLAVNVLGQNLDELDKRSRELLGQIIDMCNEMNERNDFTEEMAFTRRDILHYLKKQGKNYYPQILQNYIAPLEAEYLELVSGGKGKTSVYKLNITVNEDGKIQAPSLINGLTSPAELRAKISPKKPRSRKQNS
ncbi:MAG: hypothetical protein NT145_07840 [Elusimicrobia bacterium]|nr:hypothetical protein [Elusimicrobiota bacterium]